MVLRVRAKFGSTILILEDKNRTLGLPAGVLNHIQKKVKRSSTALASSGSSGDVREDFLVAEEAESL